MSTCAVSYPNEPPIECAAEMVNLIRNGRLFEERARFARHAWNVQGYLQRVLIGQPIDAVGQRPFTMDDAVEALESLADDARPSDDAIVQLSRWRLMSLLLRWILEQLVRVAVEAEA